MEKKNLKDIGEALRAMDFLVRSLNDEELVITWLYVGIADGDCQAIEDDEELGESYEDGLDEITGLFLRLMTKAQKHGLYIGGKVVGMKEETEDDEE